MENDSRLLRSIWALVLVVYYLEIAAMVDGLLITSANHVVANGKGFHPNGRLNLDGYRQMIKIKSQHIY